MRTERARLSTLSDDMPGKLPPQPGDGPLGRPNPELRRIYDQINDLRKERWAASRRSAGHCTPQAEIRLDPQRYIDLPPSSSAASIESACGVWAYLRLTGRTKWKCAAHRPHEVEMCGSQAARSGNVDWSGVGVDVTAVRKRRRRRMFSADGSLALQLVAL